MGIKRMMSKGLLGVGIISLLTLVSVDQVAAQGLVGWWRAEGDATDIVGGNNGTLENGATFAAGQVGQAFSFDGVNDFVSAGTIASTPEGTMDAWIRPSGDYSDTQFVMAGLSASGADVSARFFLAAKHQDLCPGVQLDSREWLVGLADGSSVQFACSGQPYDSTNFPAGVWTHIAATYDGANVKFYKDGQLIATVPQTVSGAGNAQPFSIGRAGAFERFGYYDGDIDEVEIFDRALTAEEIQALFDAGSGQCVTPPSGLVSWWPGDGDATDIVGSNDGTLVGDATFTAGKVGQGFIFDGSGDYVEIPVSASLNLAQFTVDAWIFIDPAQLSPKFHAIVGNSTGSHLNPGYVLGYDTRNIGEVVETLDALQFFVRESLTASSFPRIPEVLQSAGFYRWTLTPTASATLAPQAEEFSIHATDRAVVAGATGQSSDERLTVGSGPARQIPPFLQANGPGEVNGRSFPPARH